MDYKYLNNKENVPFHVTRVFHIPHACLNMYPKLQLTAVGIRQAIYTQSASLCRLQYKGNGNDMEYPHCLIS